MIENKLLMTDEAYLILDGNDDKLKEHLRKIEGVPNVSYLVKDREVFVFDKLVAEVKKQQAQGATESLQDLALGLISISTISPEEAIESWHIVPKPYSLEIDNANGSFIIRHNPFNSIIPVFFDNRKDVNKALALLLLGEDLKGDGDFVYCGQPMKLCEPINIELLPYRPIIRNTPESTGSQNIVYSRLSNSRFIEGFEPVSENLFDDIKSLEISWAKDSNYASLYSSNHSELIWERVQEFPLETLNDSNDTVPDCGQEEIIELRSIYPELSMLTDGSLYKHFDSYQVDCCYINGWTSDRDDSFLFFLLGKMVSNDCGGLDVEEIGKMLSYSLLNGDLFNDSLKFSSSWYQYDRAIKSLAHRVADVILFLEAERKQENLQGRKVTTLMDVLRSGRKLNQ